MKLFELFDSRDKKKRMSHIKNLVALACSDGELDQNELGLIFRVGAKAGLSKDELVRITTRPDSIEFYPPESHRERVEQLYDMVLVMMVDGEVHENEQAVCKIIAHKLGFKPEVIDVIVLSIIEKIAEGIIADLAIASILSDLE